MPPLALAGRSPGRAVTLRGRSSALGRAVPNEMSEGAANVCDMEAADLQKASKRLAEYSDEKLQELRDKYNAASEAWRAAYTLKAKVLIVVPIHTSPDTYLYRSSRQEVQIFVDFTKLKWENRQNIS